MIMAAGFPRAFRTKAWIETPRWRGKGVVLRYISADDIHRTRFLHPRVLSCKRTGVEPVPQGEPRSDRADATIRAT